MTDRGAPSGPSSEERGEAGLRSPTAHRMNTAALVVIVASLGAVALLSILHHRTSDGLRRELLALSDPARTLAADLTSSLVKEMSALRGYALFGRAEYLADYQNATDSVRQLRTFLRPLVVELGVDASVVGTLDQGIDRWHAQVDSALSVSGDDLDTDLVLLQATYDSVLTSAGRLEEVVAQEAQRRMFLLRGRERATLMFTVSVMALALVAALVVAWLGVRLRRATRQARLRGRRLEDLMRAKERLVRGLTHDIKNNLTSVLGYVELLEMGVAGPLEGLKKDYLGGIHVNAQQAVKVIRELLRTSREGVRDFRPRTTDLGDLVTDVARQQLGALEAAGLSLKLNVPLDAPVVKTDPDRVSEILKNLLNNAAKYASDGGEVRARVRLREPGEEGDLHPWVTVEVEDLGPGIAIEDQERIFYEFDRLDPDSAEGTGIGLAHSRRVARELQGDLTVESETGAGTTFLLWLPARDPVTSNGG